MTHAGKLCLTISHHIFLSQEQRYALAKDSETQVETIGVSVPVWCRATVEGFGLNRQTDEPADEVFCKYYLDNRQCGKVIEILKDGYCMHFASEATRKRLLDVKDGGAIGLQFSFNTRGVSLPSHRIVHFVQLEDEDILFDSLSCCNYLVKD